MSPNLLVRSVIKQAIRGGRKAVPRRNFCSSPLSNERKTSTVASDLNKKISDSYAFSAYLTLGGLGYYLKESILLSDGLDKVADIEQAAKANLNK